MDNLTVKQAAAILKVKPVSAESMFDLAMRGEPVRMPADAFRELMADLSKPPILTEHSKNAAMRFSERTST